MNQPFANKVEKSCRFHTAKKNQTKKKKKKKKKKKNQKKKQNKKNLKKQTFETNNKSISLIRLYKLIKSFQPALQNPI